MQVEGQMLLHWLSRSNWLMGHGSDKVFFFFFCVRKTVNSDCFLHVCPSAGNNLASNGRIFMSIFRKSVENIQVSLTSNNNNGYFT